MILNIKPMPAPRPRTKIIAPKNGKPFAQVYQPTAYRKYLQDLQYLIKAQDVPAGNFTDLDIVFMLTYPKSTPLSKRKGLAPHTKKPDIDNLIKGVLDALQMAGVIANDSQIAGITAKKIYTAASDARIQILMK